MSRTDLLSVIQGSMFLPSWNSANPKGVSSFTQTKLGHWYILLSVVGRGKTESPEQAISYASDTKVAHISYTHIPLVRTSHMATPCCQGGWEMWSLARQSASCGKEENEFGRREQLVVYTVGEDREFPLESKAMLRHKEWAQSKQEKSAKNRLEKRSSTLCIKFYFIFTIILRAGGRTRMWVKIRLKILEGWGEGQRWSRSGPSLGDCSLHLSAPQARQFMNDGLTFGARNKADIADFQTFLKSDLTDGCGSKEAGVVTWSPVLWGILFRLNCSLEKVLREPLFLVPQFR